MGCLSLGPDGEVREWFALQKQNVSWLDLLVDLGDLRRTLGTPLIVVWDRLAAHRKAARACRELGLDWVRFRWLPRAAPELNPVEGMWSDVKYGELANVAPLDGEEHRRRVECSLRRAGRRRSLLRSFFAGAGLPLEGFSCRRRRG